MAHYQKIQCHILFHYISRYTLRVSISSRQYYIISQYYCAIFRRPDRTKFSGIVSVYVYVYICVCGSRRCCDRRFAADTPDVAAHAAANATRSRCTRDSIAPSRFSPRHSMEGGEGPRTSHPLDREFAMLFAQIVRRSRSRSKRPRRALAFAQLRAAFLFWSLRKKKNKTKERGKSRFSDRVIIRETDNCDNLIIRDSYRLYSRGATIYRLRAHRRHTLQYIIRLMSFTCLDSRVP